MRRRVCRDPLRIRWTCLVAAALLAWGGGRAAADAPPGARTRADAAFGQLLSPAEAERRDGVATLVGLLPDVRERVLEALPRSPWGVQMLLIEVLVRDGSERAVDALLRHLRRTDETQAVRIRTLVVRDAQLSARLLAAYRADPRAFLRGEGEAPEGIRRLAALVQLLLRAEIEAVFISRKSRSGSTGYYRGQYEALRDPKRGPTYRALALEVCTGIALDQAVPVPGLYTTGVYRFLRPHTIDEWELRSMAINAVSETATADDLPVLARLDRALTEAREESERLYTRLYRLRRRYAIDSKPFQDALFDWDDALGEYADLVACLYLIAPDRYDARVEAFLSELDEYAYPYVPIRRHSYIAGILIRVGWYERAIRAYDETMDWGGSKALGYYNQACAYASWSRQETLSPMKRAWCRRNAIRCLEQAVMSGWSDTGWMEEDRDLDPIRDTDNYRALVRYIDQRSRPPGEDD